MLTITDLKTRAKKLREIADLVIRLAETERAEMATISNDRTRSQEWKKEAAAKIRETSRPALHGTLERMRDLYAEVERRNPATACPCYLWRGNRSTAARRSNQGSAADDRLDAAAKRPQSEPSGGRPQAMPLQAAQLWVVRPRKAGSGPRSTPPP
jgi:hypothetical protein